MNVSFKAGLIFSMLAGLQTSALSQGISLEEVIREVSTKSDSVKILQETVIKSKMQIKEQWANALPTVLSKLAGASNLIAINPANGQPLPNIKPSPLYNASIDISQPLYTFGKVGTAIKVANFYDSSNQLSYKRGIEQLQLLGLDAFYRVILAEMSLVITERSLERKKELNEFLTRNFKLGKGSKAQILSTSADLESLFPEIIKARQGARSAKMQLCVLMGRPMSDSIQLDTSSSLQSVLSEPLPSREVAVKAAFENRSDLHSIDFLKKANDGGAKIFKAMYLPSIAGTFSFGVNGDKPGDIADWAQRNWRAGIGVQWMMFDGFANSAKASQYQSDSRKLEIKKNSFAKIIEIEIENALTDCIVADSNLPASRIVFAAAQEAYDLTAENFKQGDGQFADLQLAEERLRQVEMGIMTARYMQMRSRAALLVAMGKTIIPTEGK